MGMFDSVVVKYPFPDGFQPTAEFQTYELGRECDSFTVTEAGKLIHHPWDGDDAEWPFTGFADLFHCGEAQATYRFTFECGAVKSIDLVRALNLIT